MLTPSQVDERLNLPRGTAKRLARRGELPAVFLNKGKIIRIPEDALAAFLADHLNGEPKSIGTRR